MNISNHISSLKEIQRAQYNNVAKQQPDWQYI